MLTNKVMSELGLLQPGLLGRINITANVNSLNNESIDVWVLEGYEGNDPKSDLTASRKFCP